MPVVVIKSKRTFSSMAGSISLVNKPYAAITNKLLLSASSSSIHSPPLKPSFVKFVKRRRRNTLRPKILTTKPYSPPPKPLETPLEQNDAGFSVVSVGNDNAPVEVSLKLLARYGLYFFVVFVIQTVVAVWMLGNSGSQKDENCDKSLNDSELNKGMSFLNEDRFDEKVEEIRVLAAKARSDEKSKDGDSVSKSSKNRVQREVSNRLIKLRKSLHSGQENFPGSYLSVLNNPVIDSETKMGNVSLVFEKKFKYKGYSSELGESPKGFGVSEKSEKSPEEIFNGGGISVNGESQNGLINFEDPKESENREKGSEKFVDGDGINGLGNGQRKLEAPKGFGGSVKSKISKGKSLKEEIKGYGKAKLVQNGQKEASRARKSRTGVIQESKLGTPSNELSQPGTSREIARKNSKTLKDSSRNGSSSKLPIKQSKSRTDMWWLNLHHVFVILMQRGSDSDGTAGFFTLKLGIEENNEFAYAIAFADRGDATNFCFLLETLFKDLGDASADIVPMSVKELQTAIDTEKWKVIVIKKNEVQLYAGQPFEDVEMALKALVEGSQSA